MRHSQDVLLLRDNFRHMFVRITNPNAINKNGIDPRHENIIKLHHEIIAISKS